MSDFDQLDKFLETELTLVAPMDLSQAARQLSARIGEGQLATTLGSGTDEERVFVWFKNVLRSIGDNGKAIWSVLGDPGFQSQSQRLAHIAVYLCTRVGVFRDWPIYEVWLLLMFSASYFSSGKTDD
jgi:hypothetical protein